MTRRHKSGRSTRHPSAIVEYCGELWRMTHRQYLAFLNAGKVAGMCPPPETYGGRRQNSIVVNPGDWSRERFSREMYEQDGTASENARRRKLTGN